MEYQELNNFFVKKLPKVVRIEPSALCNLKCLYCPTGTNPPNFKQGIMSEKVFERIIGQIKKAGTVKVVVLYHGGEPFLNKNLFQMIKRVKELGIGFVKTVTNGVLVQESGLAGLIDSGLDAIEFSLDGLSPEENNKIRRGSDYRFVIRTVKGLIKLKQERKSRKPAIFIANTQIPSEEVIKKNIAIKPPEYIINDLAGLKDEVGFKCCYMLKWPGFDLTNHYKIVEAPHQANPADSCDNTIETITIRANGDVVPCCYDLTNQYVLGNIMEQDLEEIWNNEKYLKLRKSIAERNYLPLCQYCPVVKSYVHICQIVE